MTTPKDFGPLAPMEAVDRVTQGREDTLYFPIQEIPQLTGLTQDELLAELKAGHLTARGFPNKTGYESVCVRFDEFLQWATSNTPLARRAMRHMLPANRVLDKVAMRSIFRPGRKH